MKLTQHLTTSQPWPKRRVARPDASPLGVVAGAASAANDDCIGPMDGSPVKAGASGTGVPSGAAVSSAGRAIRRVEAGVGSITRNAARADSGWRRPCCITVDNGKEFHGIWIAEFDATLLPRTANTTDNRARGDK